MQRKLTVILSADVVGYSALMAGDEAGTLERLKANRARTFEPHLAIHGGRQFKLMGDGALVEFSSVIAALECALAIQGATEKAAAAETEARRIRYRIGINLGEVIVEGDDIYGEGVNVAARLQALAPAGGIALSRVVKEQVEGKIGCAFDDMGEHQVKDHDRPVHAFSARPANAAPPPAPAVPAGEPQRLSICVLPFANISDDPQQEYFSDGITEDIITDLSKVPALFVISRNNAFMYKGKHVDIPKVARELKVSHVLEGSVRKAGNRVRITAQLIAGGDGGHAWAERYDRNLDDIFAIQDEISEAIVKALKLTLLPQEKKAIEQRGTANADAYNLYLMARQNYVIGNEGVSSRAEAIVRLCRRAIEIDPNYAQAWALMAQGQMVLFFTHGVKRDNGLAAVEHALALDRNLPEAHAIRSRILSDLGRADEADADIATALRLNPESYEVNRAAARLAFRKRALEDAARHFEKATALMETDFNSPLMLMTCYRSLGRVAGVQGASRIALVRAEKALSQDQNNGAAMAAGVDALAVLGDVERAHEWIERALLIDPDNLNMRYNFACTMVTQLHDDDKAIELLEPVFAKWNIGFIRHARADPDLDPLRGNPRFQAMLAAAEARVAAESG